MIAADNDIGFQLTSAPTDPQPPAQSPPSDTSGDIGFQITGQGSSGAALMPRMSIPTMQGGQLKYLDPATGQLTDTPNTGEALPADWQTQYVNRRLMEPGEPGHALAQDVPALRSMLAANPDQAATTARRILDTTAGSSPDYQQRLRELHDEPVNNAAIGVLISQTKATAEKAASQAADQAKADGRQATQDDMNHAAIAALAANGITPDQLRFVSPMLKFDDTGKIADQDVGQVVGRVRGLADALARGTYSVKQMFTDAPAELLEKGVASAIDYANGGDANAPGADMSYNPARQQLSAMQRNNADVYSAFPRSSAAEGSPLGPQGIAESVTEQVPGLVALGGLGKGGQLAKSLMTGAMFAQGANQTYDSVYQGAKSAGLSDADAAQRAALWAAPAGIANAYLMHRFGAGRFGGESSGRLTAALQGAMGMTLAGRGSRLVDDIAQYQATGRISDSLKSFLDGAVVDAISGGAAGALSAPGRAPQTPQVEKGASNPPPAAQMPPTLPAGGAGEAGNGATQTAPAAEAGNLGDFADESQLRSPTPPGRVEQALPPTPGAVADKGVTDTRKEAADAGRVRSDQGQPGEGGAHAEGRQESREQQAGPVEQKAELLKRAAALPQGTLIHGTDLESIPKIAREGVQPGDTYSQGGSSDEATVYGSKVNAGDAGLAPRYAGRRPGSTPAILEMKKGALEAGDTGAGAVSMNSRGKSYVRPEDIKAVHIPGQEPMTLQEAARFARGTAEAKKLGIKYNGSEGGREAFTDPKTGTTFHVKLGEKIADKLAQSRENFEATKAASAEKAAAAGGGNAFEAGMKGAREPEAAAIGQRGLSEGPPGAVQVQPVPKQSAAASAPKTTLEKIMDAAASVYKAAKGAFAGTRGRYTRIAAQQGADIAQALTRKANEPAAVAEDAHRAFTRDAFGDDEELKARWWQLGQAIRGVNVQERAQAKNPNITPEELDSLYSGPKMTRDEIKAAMADAGMARAAQIWNEQYSPALSEIRTRNKLLMDPEATNRAKFPFFINMPTEFEGPAGTDTSARSGKAFNQKFGGKGNYQSDPNEGIKAIIRGHVDTDATQNLTNLIRKKYSSKLPEDVLQANGYTDTIAGKKTELEKIDLGKQPGYEGKAKFAAKAQQDLARATEDWGNLDNGPAKQAARKAMDEAATRADMAARMAEKASADNRWVPKDIAREWNRLKLANESRDTLYDRINGAWQRLATMGTFLPHMARVAGLTASRMARAGEFSKPADALRFLPSWLGSNEAALAEAHSMNGKPWGDAMQYLLDSWGANRGTGHGAEGETRSGIANFGHRMLFDPETGADILARRVVGETHLRMVMGNEAVDALEAKVADGTLSPLAAAGQVKARLSAKEAIDAGQYVNGTLGFSNYRTRSSLLNALQRVGVPYVGSESGMIPSDVGRVATGNVSPEQLAGQIKGGRFKQAALGAAQVLTSGALGYYAMLNGLNYMHTLAQTGKGHFMWDNEEGHKGDLWLANGVYLGNLDPSFARGMRLSSIQGALNGKGESVASRTKEALQSAAMENVNEGLSVMTPQLKGAFGMLTAAAGAPSTLYLHKDHEGNLALRKEGWGDLIPVVGNTVNAATSGKSVLGGAAQDVTRVLGPTLKLEEPPTVKGRSRNPVGANHFK